jgi:predicted glycoside hydrolase/deacetylase ChbG (UPF0249 family)
MHYLLTVCTLFLCNANANAENWAERLDFPPGSRVVILNGREVGVSWEMNEACKDLLQAGQISAVDAVVTGPWFQQFADWSKQNPQYDVGISIALTNPYSSPSWRLLTSELGHTTLVDALGQPWKSVVQLTSHATAQDVKTELDAQILKAQQAGLTPTHLSSYYGTVFSRVDLASVFLGAAKKYWIPATLVELTPEMAQHFREQGYPIDDAMVELIANYPLPKVDDLQMSPVADSYEAKTEAFIEMLRTLQPGLTEIIMLPAVESRGLQYLGANWQQRAWDAKLLADPRVAEAMSSEKIIVTNWREIMERFEGVKPFELREATDEQGEDG